MTTRPLTSLALVAALTSCVAQREVEPLDPAVVAELQQIADVLSRPHDFSAGQPVFGGRGSTRHPIDFGCALPETFLPDSHWSKSGLATGTSDMRASSHPSDRVARACLRLEQLGSVGLFRDQLQEILSDRSLGEAMRCQAAHALGTLPDERIAEALARAVGDEVVGPESLRALVRIGPVRLDGIRAAGLPTSEPARSRVIWLLSRHVEDLKLRELRWLADALDGPSSRESLWCLWRVHDTRAPEVVNELLRLLRRDDPPLASLALAAGAHVRDPRVIRIVLAITSHRDEARRQLALQHLGSIESPRAFDLLLRLAGDGAATPGDRAAALLSLSNYRTGQVQWVAEAGGLLASRKVTLRRAALRALASAPDLPRDILALIEPLRRDADYDIRFLAWSAMRK